MGVFRYPLVVIEIFDTNSIDSAEKAAVGVERKDGLRILDNDVKIRIPCTRIRCQTLNELHHVLGSLPLVHYCGFPASGSAPVFECVNDVEIDPVEPLAHDPPKVPQNNLLPFLRPVLHLVVARPVRIQPAKPAWSVRRRLPGPVNPASVEVVAVRLRLSNAQIRKNVAVSASAKARNLGSRVPRPLGPVAGVIHDYGVVPLIRKRLERVRLQKTDPPTHDERRR